MKRLLRAPQEIFHIASVTNLGRPTCVSKKYTWPLVSQKLSTTTRMFLFLQITKYVYLKTPQPTTLTHCQSLVFSSWRNYDNQHFYCKSMIIFSYLTRFHSSDLQVSFPFWNQYLTTTGAYGWLYIQKKEENKNSTRWTYMAPAWWEWQDKQFTITAWTIYMPYTSKL